MSLFLNGLYNSDCVDYAHKAFYPHRDQICAWWMWAFLDVFVRTLRVHFLVERSRLMMSSSEGEVFKSQTIPSRRLQAPQELPNSLLRAACLHTTFWVRLSPKGPCHTAGTGRPLPREPPGCCVPAEGSSRPAPTSRSPAGGGGQQFL